MVSSVSVVVWCVVSAGPNVARPRRHGTGGVDSLLVPQQWQQSVTQGNLLWVPRRYAERRASLGAAEYLPRSSRKNCTRRVLQMSMMDAMGRPFVDVAPWVFSVAADGLGTPGQAEPMARVQKGQKGASQGATTLRAQGGVIRWAGEVAWIGEERTVGAASICAVLGWAVGWARLLVLAARTKEFCCHSERSRPAVICAKPTILQRSMQNLGL